MGNTLMAVCLATVAVVGQTADKQDLFVFVASDNKPAKIRLDFGRRAEQPISRLLYGKFTEHLGRNIYHGMWAQLVRNSGFEPADLWGGRAMRTAAFWARNYQMPDLVSWIERGLPPGWAAFGNVKANYAVDRDSFNSRQCLRIRIVESQRSPSGTCQPLDLPVHRQLVYDWSLHVRAEQDVQLSVRLRYVATPTLAAETVVAVKAGAWRELSGQLRLPKRPPPDKGHFLLEIGFREPATVWLDQCLLFPADHQDGWDPDIVQWVKESNLPILRWPGGNFASGYHWKDGIGPLHERPARLNRPWKMPEPNHVGTDEFMRFCELARCEPMICVNAGDGTAEEAADWVEYCNGSTITPMGRLRAAHGHPQPYGVRYWEIGNELYGRWQIGHCTAEEYAGRYRRFVAAMRQRDADIHFIANGHNLDWNRSLIENCSDILRSISVHTLVGGGIPGDTEPEKVWWSLAGYPHEYRQHLGALSLQLRRRVPHGKLAITELQIFTNRPNMPNNSGLAEALFWAGIINTAVRAGDRVEIVTHSALVNHGGGLRKRSEVVYANPVFLARRLYATQPGRWPIGVHLEGPAFSTGRLHNLPPVHEAPILDVLTLASDRGDQLVLLVTNRHAHDPVPADISLDQFTATGNADWEWISGADILAANSLDLPRAVKLEKQTVPVSGSRFNITFPARSVSAITLTGFGASK